MNRLSSAETAEALRIAKRVYARAPHETIAAALLDALDSARILTERVEDAERRRLDLAGLCAQESSRADRTERDLECARNEVKRLSSESIDDHCAHRTAMDNVTRHLTKAERELARVRALVPQIAGAAAAWGGERSAEEGDMREAARLEKKLDALLADAARDGRAP